jgi:protein phosphatase
LRNGSLTQVSEDQTLVASLVREGKLTKEEAEHSPVSNVIVQALGMGPEIAPIIWSEPLPLVDGDVVVLCSDGLTGMVSEAVIAETVARLAPSEACEALIQAALTAGGHDNISVGVLRATSEKDAAAGAGRTTRRMRIPEAPGETRELAIPSEPAGHNG